MPSVRAQESVTSLSITDADVEAATCNNFTSVLQAVDRLHYRNRRGRRLTGRFIHLSSSFITSVTPRPATALASSDSVYITVHSVHSVGQ